MIQQQKIWIHFFLGIVLLLGVSFCYAKDNALSEEGKAKDEAMQKIVVRFLDIFRLSQNKSKEEQKALLVKVSGETIDFRYFSASIMGKFYKKFGSEGAERLSKAMQESFVQLYFQNQKTFQKSLDPKKTDIRFRPVHFTNKDETRGLKDVVLEMKGAKKPFVITLSFRQNKRTKEWRIVNLIFQGINYGLNMRGVFYSAMAKHQDSLDEVIKSWNQIAQQQSKQKEKQGKQ